MDNKVWREQGKFIKGVSTYGDHMDPQVDDMQDGFPDNYGDIDEVFNLLCVIIYHLNVMHFIEIIIIYDYLVVLIHQYKNNNVEIQLKSQYAYVQGDKHKWGIRINSLKILEVFLIYMTRYIKIYLNG
eukprot:10244_1